MKPGIVICTRLNSKRIREKALVEVGGRPAIRLLVERLLKNKDIPVCLALAGNPEDEKIYEALKDLPISWFRGHPDNVLARFFWASEEMGFDPGIRITHDDILQDGQLIQKMLSFYQANGVDYLYISQCVRGMDAEIISRRLLESAYKKFGKQPIEHISHVLRNTSCNPVIKCFDTPPEYQSHISMSLDEPEDLTALRLLFHCIHPLASGIEITEVLNTCPEISAINHKPELSIYTCVHNAEDTLEVTGLSVLNLQFKDFEYIIYDDGSTDSTTTAMVNLASADKRIRLMRNPLNRGLAAACNAVLPHLRGDMCLRLDADDELLPEALDGLVELMRQNNLLTAVYPAYYRGVGIEIVENTEHHVGGALMRTRVLKELRFCDGLRHWEGKELFERLSEKYQIQEYGQPTWRYHNTKHSLSNDTTAQRIKQGRIYSL
ncbi:MAG: glycosyltransferase [Endomicrobiia bacterium]|nr:glycosyltransferase [Endomicrobiia bacterium]